MKEYPKAMYLGTKKKRQKLTHAKDYDHEQVLRGNGFLPYVELPDDAQTQAGVMGGGDCAELRQNYEQLQSNYQQLQDFNASLTQNWNDIDAVRNRLNELHGSQVPPVISDLEKMTVLQLKEFLTARGVGFNPSSNKADLLDLAKNLVELPVIEDEE